MIFSHEVISRNFTAQLNLKRPQKSKLIFKNTHPLHTSTNLCHPLPDPAIVVKPKQLVKWTLVMPVYWSAGMLSKTLFHHDFTLSKKYLNPLNARKEWGLWVYSASLFLEHQTYAIAQLHPWCIRTRRYLQYLTHHTQFITVMLLRKSATSPKRRIKRWLKKKYTTQSWR